MITLKPSPKTNSSAAFKTAIEAAFEELRKVSEDIQHAHEYLEKLERRSNEIDATIRGLISMLPAEEAKDYLDILSPPHAPVVDDSRGGDVYNNVVSLVFKNRQQEWDSTRIRNEFAKSGLHADNKAILNVLNYLTKTDRLERISRGRYRVKETGVLIESGTDLEDIE